MVSASNLPVAHSAAIDTESLTGKQKRRTKRRDWVRHSGLPEAWRDPGELELRSG